MRNWALDQLTVVGVRPAELVEIAARAGYDAVSPFVGLGENDTDLFMVPLRAGDPDTVAMARALRDTGLRFNQADGFAISDEFDIDAAGTMVRLVAELGARNIIAMQFDSDESRGFDRLCRLNELAEAAGVGMAIEFMAISKIPSLASAVDVVARINSANTGLLIDLLHLSQSGETPDDIARLSPDLIRGAQLCDAPAKLDFETYLEMAMGNRLAPGTGELPVADFLCSLPSGITVGLEIPMPSIKDWDERAAHVLRLAKQSDKALPADSQNLAESN